MREDAATGMVLGKEMLIAGGGGDRNGAEFKEVGKGGVFEMAVVEHTQRDWGHVVCAQSWSILAPVNFREQFENMQVFEATELGV